MWSIPLRKVGETTRSSDALDEAKSTVCVEKGCTVVASIVANANFDAFEDGERFVWTVIVWHSCAILNVVLDRHSMLQEWRSRRRDVDVEIRNAGPYRQVKA
jgi:hypothetical protein